jgi:hypothetical protein
VLRAPGIQEHSWRLQTLTTGYWPEATAWALASRTASRNDCCRCRHSYFAMKDGGGRVVTAIDGLGGIIVATDRRPGQRDSGKQPLARE